MTFKLLKAILSLTAFAAVANFANPEALALRNELYITSLGTNEVLRYDGDTGEFLGTFISSGKGLVAPDGFVFGPDGNAYVSGFFSDNILKYNGVTGEFLGIFADNIPGPAQVVFDRDGNLLVNTYGDQLVNDYGDETGCLPANSCAVLKYDGITGTFLGVFASGSGLNGPDGLVIGSDNNLYVSSFRSNQILKYDGETGEFLGVFASGSEMNAPSGFTFSPDGNLYVTSWFGDQVLKYDGTTGAFLGVFASGNGLDSPNRVAFGPDNNLYVSSLGSNQVLKYDGTTGSFLGTFGSGYTSPSDLIFVTVPESSSVLGILWFGSLGGMFLLKRKQKNEKWSNVA
ncbi:MAG: NHL repeat-containing protein [Nostoc sp.]|uniref:Vgb family protein n=1 Tax=Nostoc sp. TaxID=1180 RepID=UPI002FFAE5E0